MSSNASLYADFAPKTLAEWQAKIEKDLRGKPLGSLRSKNADDIDIEPAYTDENSLQQDQAFKSAAQWDTVQELFVQDAKSANAEALDHLNRGATSLLFYLYGDCDLETLLHDIKVEFIRVNFVVEGDALGLAKRFLDLLEKRGLNPNDIVGSFNIDCLEILARTGNWTDSEEADFERIKSLQGLLPNNFKGICINANLFANAGATLAQQLGIALSMVYEYIYRLTLKNTEGFWLNLAVGSDYFGEIAKLRAMRRLWSQLHASLELEETEAHIYAETALRNKTIKDRYNNMIRSTAEAMAAVIGGANEISVKGFNHTYKMPDAFGERIAKNQLSILEHESHLNQVRDMAQGAYFIETLTEQLAEKAWAFFKEIEAKGGFVSAMKNNWLQTQVAAAAEVEQEAFDTQQKVLIGANKYAQADENLEEIIEQAMFYKSSGGATAVQKVTVKRLAESLEH